MNCINHTINKEKKNNSKKEWKLLEENWMQKIILLKLIPGNLRKF